MNNIKGLSEKNRLLLQEVMGEIRREAYAEGFEAGKVVAETWSNANPVLVKSPNQQRAELIQRAKDIVYKNLTQSSHTTLDKFGFPSDVEFFRKGNKITCVLTPRDKNIKRSVGSVYCNEEDVFNVEIGRIVAFHKAKGIPVPVEFLEAVQPNEKVVGMIVKYYSSTTGYDTYRLVKSVSEAMFTPDAAQVNSPRGEKSTIIDDTNAQYEVNTCNE